MSLDPVTRGCDLVTLSAGAANPPDPNDIFNFAYNVIEFDWEPSLDALRVTVHPRMWSDEIKAFVADSHGLGRERPVFALGCPNFRRVNRADDRGDGAAMTGISETAPAEEPAICTSERRTPTADVGGEEMPDEYPLLLLRFFRDLSGSQRLSVLVKLGAMPPDWQEPLTHTMERRVLDSLKARGQLDLLKKAMSEVEDESRLPGERAR